MRLQNKLVAIDLETTASDWKEGSIVQIGAVIINENFTIGGKFSTYIRPLDGFREPEAMAIHGIDELTLAQAPDIYSALMAFESFSQKAGNYPMLAAWGTYFDCTYLRETYQKLERKMPFSRRCLDLKSIALWEAAKRDMLKVNGVGGFAAALGMDFEGKQHDALDDIKNTMRVLRRFL